MGVSMQSDCLGWRPCQGVPDQHPSGACDCQGHGAIPGPRRGPAPSLLPPRSCQPCAACPGLGGRVSPSHPSLMAQGLRPSPVAQGTWSPTWCGGRCTQGRVPVFPAKALCGLRATSLPIPCPLLTLGVLLAPALRHGDEHLARLRGTLRCCGDGQMETHSSLSLRVLPAASLCKTTSYCLFSH